MSVVTRFAPSPTGYLHLGNVRTALLNWLFARKHGGRFLLRFEDTDQNRSEQEFIAAIEEDLGWLGLNWDGAPKFQSAHHGDHGVALQKLAASGHSYRCFCSETQLAIDRKLCAARGLPPRYAGRCRHLSAEQIEAKIAAGDPFVWRLAVHGEGMVLVRDLLRSEVRFACADLDDPVVVRSDGSFTFLLPNAVDDALDGITHALRGDDHLTNSAYQVWLLERLGYTPPVYLHHGLLLGSDGGKLSKRSGSLSVREMRAAGLLPEALIQAMARLGHPNLSDDLHTPSDLAANYAADHLSSSSVRWSEEAMWRWHTRLLHKLPPGQLAPLLAPHLPPLEPSRLLAFAGLVEGNLERAEDVRHFLRLLAPNAAIEAEALAAAREAGADFFRAALAVWQAGGHDWASFGNGVKAATGARGKALFMPLRAALTGAAHGPEMSKAVAFLGEDGVAERLEQTLSMLEPS